MRCHEFVESQYDCDGSDKEKGQGGRVSTTDVCCLCYGDSDIASREEILRRQKQAAMQPLPVCRSCLELDIKIPGGGINYVKRRENEKARKEALARRAIASGRKKRRSGR